MSAIRHIIGIDISTQTITAMLIGVEEERRPPGGTYRVRRVDGVAAVRG